MAVETHELCGLDKAGEVPVSRYSGIMVVDACGTLNCIGLGPNFVKKEQGVGRMSPACLTGA